MKMTFEIFTKMQEAQAAKVQAATKAYNDIVAATAAKHGVAPRLANGLTPDAIKFSPDVMSARRTMESAINLQRNFNGDWCGQFKNEIRAAVVRKRAAGTTPPWQ